MKKTSLIYRSIKLLSLLHVHRAIHMKENFLTRFLSLSLHVDYEVMKALEIMTVVANDDFLLAFVVFVFYPVAVAATDENRGMKEKSVTR